mmetsp:Transcript_5335/g.13788  ORF Transcript_5335/g.13788 Transcript_5335/m.13788 type:complete len:267 (+) Transcript_5335:864-1664(+)
MFIGKSAGLNASFRFLTLHTTITTIDKTARAAKVRDVTSTVASLDVAGLAAALSTGVVVAVGAMVVTPLPDGTAVVGVLLGCGVGEPTLENGENAPDGAKVDSLGCAVGKRAEPESPGRSASSAVGLHVGTTVGIGVADARVALGFGVGVEPVGRPEGGTWVELKGLLVLSRWAVDAVAVAVSDTPAVRAVELPAAVDTTAGGVATVGAHVVSSRQCTVSQYSPSSVPHPSITTSYSPGCSTVVNRTRLLGTSAGHPPSSRYATSL